jgi:hypothetical protein
MLGIMEHPNIADKDFRLQAVTTLAEDFTSPEGVIHKAGAVVVLSGSAKYDSTRTLSFGIPNMTALCLDHAYINWVQSQHFLEEEEFLESSSLHVPSGTIRPKDDAIFFHLLEERMAAIVFAYTALESFANESIPEDYVFRKERDDKKCTEVYTKPQAEVLSLDTKLDYVLPLVFGVTSPKKKNIWTRYMLIKKLRDRIIHMKSKDRRSTTPNEDTVWRELLNKSNPNVALEAKDIIAYYLNNVSEKPRWFEQFPWHSRNSK